MYKLAVYSICKNEKNNLLTYLTAAEEADYIVILDTGSTDGTWEALQEYAKSPRWKGKLIIDQKTYSPWRFDTPRNDNLAMIPADAEICWQVDLDEVIQEGAIAQVKAAWQPNTKMCWYKYSWSVNEDDTPRVQFWYNKIHKKDFWYWRFPVHETLYTKNGQEVSSDEQIRLNEDFVHHHPENKESRNSYLSLLELRYAENPEDDMTIAYLEHQYFYDGEYQKCIDFARQVTIPFFQKNCNQLMVADAYYFMGWAYEELGNGKVATSVYELGIRAYPPFRNNWFKLGQRLIAEKRYDDALDVLSKMLFRSQRLYSWLELLDCFEWEPYDLMSLALYYSGHKLESLNMAKAAVALQGGTNQRLIDNVKIIEENL